MTREEAIAFFKDMNECTYGNLEAVEMAIKALKQESSEDVLDKIRNEMADLASRTMDDNRASGIWTCVDILDKYKRK